MELSLGLERPRLNGEGTEPVADSRSPLLHTALGAAFALGIVVRAVFVLTADFPLNDGGLFYVMIEELQRAQYHLPAFTAYNRAGIPYAYPPFGFYVAGLVDDLTPLTRLDVLRVVPFVMSLVIVGAFVVLARALIGMGWTLVAAVVAFALLPSGFIWIVMGGGVTRAWGFLFALLALHQAFLLYTRREHRFIATTALFVGLTALSHIGTMPFLAFSLLLFLAVFGRHRYGLISSCLVALGGAAVAAGWVWSVAAVHGIDPFVAARSSGISILSADAEMRRYVLGILARFGVGSAMGGSTGEPLFPLIGVSALIGTLASLTPRRLLLPVWWIMILLLDQRAGYTYAAVPIAMLAGIGVTEVAYPVLAWPGFARRHFAPAEGALDVSRAPGPHRPAARKAVPALVLAVLLIYATASALLTDPALPSAVRFLVSLSPEEREAMQWVAESTDPESRFVVIPESEWSTWSTDKTAEWFPALTGRASLSTVQGYEWMPNQAFMRRRKAYNELRRCVNGEVRCVEEWAKAGGLTFTHVYISQPPYTPQQRWRLCCQPLIQSLKADRRFRLVYEAPGAVIFARH